LGVGIYTHWNGTELPSMVQDGLRLARDAGRLYDGGYCVRIVIEHLLSHSSDKTLGWGIFSADEGHEDSHGGPMVVDLDAKTVCFKPRGKRLPIEPWLAGPDHERT
jgi:hypothetical protein